MSRGLAGALVTAAESNHIRPLIFVKLEFDSGTMYLHDGIGTFTWSDPDDGSQDWLGLGDFGGISGVEESTELSPFEINLVLSGIDADNMDEVLNQQFYLRPVTVYMGALNVETGVLVADPDEVWSGFMDKSAVTLGEENAIAVTCESELSMFERSNGRVYSDADLQAEYSGDLWFEYLPSMTNAKIIWRGKGDATNFGGPGDGSTYDPYRDPTTRPGYHWR